MHLSIWPAGCRRNAALTAPYTAAELAAILATHARFEMCKPMDCWRDAAYQLAEDVPRLVAELTRAREALRELVLIDGSSENVANALVLASRVRNIALEAPGEEPADGDTER